MKLLSRIERKRSLDRAVKEVCQGKKFNWKQKKEIQDGFKDGLIQEQVEVFAKECFDNSQMQTIWLSYKEGLTIEQVKFLARPEFTVWQMWCAQGGFEKGFTLEQITLYYKAEFESAQMHMIMQGYEDGLSMEQVKIYANSKFTSHQMQQIEEALKNGLTEEQIKPMLNTSLDHYQLEFYYKSILKGRCWHEIEPYLNHKIDWSEWNVIEKGIESGLSQEQINIYAKDCFNYWQMEEMFDGFLNGLSIEQVALFAKKEYDYKRMRFIKQVLLEGDLSEVQVRLFAAPEFLASTYSLEQMREIVNGFRDGLSIIQVKSYYHPSHSYTEMMRMRYELTKKRKDSYYYSTIGFRNHEFFDSKSGKIFNWIAAAFLFFVLLLQGIGLYKLIEEPIVNTCNIALLWIFRFSIFTQVFNWFLIAFSPHPDTSRRHILNIIISIVLFVLCEKYMPNATLILTFRYLILLINGVIYRYLQGIKYYS